MHIINLTQRHIASDVWRWKWPGVLSGSRAPWRKPLQQALESVGFITGLFWYPPNGVREWHTNRYDTPGWRVYLTHVVPEQPFEVEGKVAALVGSSVSYWQPHQRTARTVRDRDAHAIIFRIGGRGEEPFWHCIKSHDVHRFSLGLHVTNESAMELVRLHRLARAQCHASGT